MCNLEMEDTLLPFDMDVRSRDLAPPHSVLLLGIGNFLKPINYNMIMMVAVHTYKLAAPLDMSLARTSKWWNTLAGVTVESIYTNALVQTGPRSAFIYVFLTVHT